MTKPAVKDKEPELFDATKPGNRPKSTAKPKTPTTGPGVKAAPAKKQEVVVHKPQPPAQPRSVLELCMMAAKDPQIPVDRLRAFLDMAEHEERKEAETLFDHAMLAAQAEMPKVPRDSYNTHTKSWWARIENVSAKVDPIARKHGFTLKYGMGEQRIPDHYHLFVDVTWSGTLASGKKASFTKRFDHDVGRDDKGPKGEGTKSLAQGSGSSVTYGRRFLKCMVFDVLILGLDRDGNPAGAEGSKITEAQAEELTKLCADKGISLPMFQQAFGVDQVADLPAIRFADVKARLKTAPKQQAKPQADQHAE